MLQHRFQEYLTEPVHQPEAAFVACPLMQFTPAHAAYVAEVYRVAREQAEAKLRKPTRSRIPEFSWN